MNPRMDYGKMFVPAGSDECCLCGSTQNLTGEHKIKAAALREMFGRQTMFIGQFEGTSEPKVAQGPKSKNLHFKSKICGDCNSSVTQPADVAFDRFHSLVLRRFSVDQNFEAIFPIEEFSYDSDEYLNVFRYFAKLLVCQIVDAGGPALPYLCAFATGLHNQNVIKMKIQADPTYQDFNVVSTEFRAFAGHGGLIVNHSKAGELTGFHSTLTLGPIQYIYWIEFESSVLLELQSAVPEFYERIRKVFAEALEKPMSDHQRRKLGL